MKIAVKSGVEQLSLFENTAFPYYEAYLRLDEDLHALLDTKMKLVALHMPSMIMTPRGKAGVDFAQEGEVADACFRKLEELLLFASENGVSYIIIHLGFFNSFRETREDVLARVAQRFNKLSCLGVKLCVENVPRWTTLCFEHEPLLSNVEHLTLFQKMCPAIGVTLDIDHLAIDTVFGYFEEGFRDRYIFESDRDRFQLIMEQEMMAQTRNSVALFTEMIQSRVVDFFEKIQPDTIHAVGSDFCNYELVEGKLPLRGEALPLGHDGMVQRMMVVDRIDHKIWLSRIRACGLITLELHLRSDYDYIRMMKENYEFVSSLIP